MSRSMFFRVAIGAALALGALFFVALRSDAFSDEVMKVLLIRDDCEADSFNAAFGPGTCVGDGNTTVAKFIDMLTKHQTIESWRFNPRRFSVIPGRKLLLESRAGETHTVTRVAEFGGGFIPPLNELTGNPIPRPECTTGVLLPNGILQPQLPSPTNIFVDAFESVPGPTAGSPQLPQGTTKWICCIHPWMRAEITVH